MNNTANNHIPVFVFSWIDYTIFGLTTLFSIAIGIYFGISRKKQTVQEYLLAGKNMNYLAVAISLISSHASGMNILAVPADIYKFGSHYIWMCLGFILAGLITYYVFLPVFFELQLRSIYEYFSIRFDKKIRLLSAFFFIITVSFYSAVTIYLPVIAFAQTTNVNMYVVLYVIGFICIFYTAIGGAKGVIWTDVFKCFGVFGGCIAVLFVVIVTSGGFAILWKKNSESGRLNILDFSLDPTIRDGFWPVVIGGTAKCLVFICFNQKQMQKYLTVPTCTSAKKVLIVECIGAVAITVLGVLLGITLYSKYSDCDPLSSKQVTRTDQLVPYFVLQTNISGLPGLFTASILSASLSSFSTSLNSAACVIFEDFLVPFLPKNITERKASNILKLIVVIFGTVCIGLVYLIQNVGGMFPLYNILQAATTGPLMGLFTLGVLVPSANTQGALVGGIAGLLFSSWMVIGINYYKSSSLNESFAKPVSVSGCSFNFTPSANVSVSSNEEVFYLYRISMWYISLLGALVTIIIGILISWLARKSHHKVNTRLLSPIVRYYIKEDTTEEERSTYPLKTF